MTIEELNKLKVNQHVTRKYGNRIIKYHVAQNIGHTVIEPERHILPIFLLLPLDKTDPTKYLWQMNCERYDILNVNN